MPRTGGPKDERAPRVDSAHSTRFGSTRFKAKKIVLTFDEWVRLDDPNQIVISPPLKTHPEAEIIEHSLVYKWRDTLRENTTYTINFGKAIKDLTEGNAAKDLRFVFSTGPIIDSLTVSGAVINATTGKPEKDISVQLYDNLRDSAVRRELPNYFATTDENGTFTLTNIRAGKYRIFAIKDANANYKYDQYDEPIAFADSLLTVPTTKKPALRIFVAEPPYKVVQTRATYGKIDLTFTRAPNRVTVRMLDGSPITTIYNQDTLTVWHQATGKVTLLVQPPTPNSLPDTVRVTAPPKDNNFKNVRLQPLAAAITTTGRGKSSMEKPNKTQQIPIKAGAATIAAEQLIVPNTPFTVAFNRLPRTTDTALVALTDSTKRRVPFTILPNKNENTTWQLAAKWREGMQYQLTLLPNALHDDYGVTNDSIVWQKIRVLTQKEVGSINVVIKGMDSTKTYLIILTDASDKPLQTFGCRQKTEFSQRIAQQKPAQYGLKVVEDTNGDQQFTSGNFYKKQQPERTWNTPAQPLRANWELELQLDISPINTLNNSTGKIKM